MKKCEICRSDATQELSCGTILVVDKTRTIKKGDDYNTIRKSFLCDDCSCVVLNSVYAVLGREESPFK